MEGYYDRIYERSTIYNFGSYFCHLCDKYIKKQKDIRQAFKEDETKKAVSKENLETDKVVSEDDSNKILSDADSSTKALNDTYLIGKQEPSDEKNINLGQPVAFDGQVSNDDSVNNMF